MLRFPALDITVSRVREGPEGATSGNLDPVFGYVSGRCSWWDLMTK